MNHFKNFSEFLFENKRPGSESYYKGLSDSTADKRAARIKKQTQMSDSDPNAYKELPGDTKGKKDLKTSKHTKKYHQMFGESIENISEGEVDTALKNKAEETGISKTILRKVYDRGLAAWKTGHKPGAGQHQWGMARVNSFVTKGKGTWGKADKDLAKQVREK